MLCSSAADFSYPSCAAPLTHSMPPFPSLESVLAVKGQTAFTVRGQDFLHSLAPYTPGGRVCVVPHAET